MANSYSTSDLVKGTLQACGEVTDGSSPYHELALKYINDVYLAVLSGSNEFDPMIGDAWTWARTGYVLTLLPANSTGTVTLTLGSVNGTFSSAPATSQVGYFFQVPDYKTFYKIATHTAGATAFTLDSSWLDVSVAGASFNSIPLVYDLGSKILRLVEPFRIYVDRSIEQWEKSEDQGRVYGIDIDTFRDKWPLRELREDVPSKFATVKHTESAWTVEFNKYPASSMRADYERIDIPDDLVDSDTSVPILPREFRKILMFGASYYLCLDKKNKDEAMNYFNLTKQTLNAMQQAETKNDSQTSNTFGVLIPRRDCQYPKLVW